MSYVIAEPEMMTSAAADLATIGSNVSAAHMVAEVPTVAVLPAAADEVSASIARLFSQHAANHQVLAAQAAAFNDQFVQHLSAGAFSYASIEAAIASFLQNLNVTADQALNYLSVDATLLGELGWRGLPLVGFAAIIEVLYLYELLTTGQITPLFTLPFGFA